MALMLDTNHYLAKQLNNAIRRTKSFLRNSHNIIEILCTRSEDELKPIMRIYEKCKF